MISTILAAAFNMAASAASLPIAPADCRNAEPSPAAPAETSQFSFLIGNYRISLHKWLGEDWSPAQPGVTARWNGWYGLGGLAIYDEWFHPDPAQDAHPFSGVNVRMYDPDAKEWDMMWIATGGRQVQDLRAKMIDGVLTMWQVYPERPDFRAEFHIDDADHWARIEFVKNDKGDWVKLYKLAAERIPCSAK